MSAILKPCPFCGGPAYVRDCSDEHSPEWQAGCVAANSRIYPLTCEMNVWASHIDEDEVIAVWNKRAEEK